MITAIYNLLACIRQNPSTADIARLVIRTIGFGRQDLVNHRNKTGLSPLHNACVRGSDDLIPLLIQYGANIELHDAHGETPLFHACKWRQNECTLELLRQGASIDAQCER